MRTDLRAARNVFCTIFVDKEEQIMICRCKSRVFAASLCAVLMVGYGGTANT